MKKAILAAILMTSLTAQAASYELIVLRQQACESASRVAVIIYDMKAEGLSRKTVTNDIRQRASSDMLPEFMRQISDVYDRQDSRSEVKQLAWARCMDNNPLN